MTQFLKACGSVVGIMFLCGLALGSCALGVKLPVALFNLAVGQ